MPISSTPTTPAVLRPASLGFAFAHVPGGRRVVKRLNRNFTAGGIWADRKPTLSRV